MANKKNRKKSQKKKRNSLTLNSLPLELSCRILDDARVENHPHSRIKACFTLAHVCKEWREIIFNTPQLWTDVTIKLDLPKRRKASVAIPERVELFESAIKLSKDLPIAVYVVSKSRYWRGKEEDLNPIVQVIKSCISRVHNLEIALPASILGKFSGLSAAPMLHQFALDAIDQEDMFNDYGKVQDIRTLTANVKKLRLRVWDMPGINLCWQRVVELEASALSPSSLLKVLREAPSVRKITALQLCSADEFEGSDEDLNGDSDDDSNEPEHAGDWLSLPELEELRLDFSYEDGVGLHASDLLNKLTLPRLRSLTFPTPQQIDSDEFVDFLERSECQLDTLDLSSPNSLDDLKKIMDLLPKLATLNLETMDEESLAGVFEAIFAPGVDDASTRGISKFSYEGTWMKEHPDWTFLKQCIRVTPSLQHLDLTVFANLRNVNMDQIWMDEENVKAIRELRAEGRHIKIEVWASGNHFEDFVEASHSRPPLRYT